MGSDEKTPQTIADNSISHSREEADPCIPGSNNSTLSTASSYTEKDSATSSVSGEDDNHSEHDVVRRVLYSSRENINILHEVFRQALLFPCSQSISMKRVIEVYRTWLSEENPPIFMKDPNNIEITVSQTAIKESSTSPNNNNKEKEYILDAEEIQRNRNFSYLAAVNNPAITEYDHIKKVGCGLQNILQIFITNAANVFLLEESDSEVLLEAQVDLCKRVLNI